MAATGRQKHSIHGWISLDKPHGMTSTQAIGAIRRLFHPKKIGHAGTLDPLATGILPLALGEATKTVPYTMDAEKVYRFRLCFGVQTTTDDKEGEALHCSDARPSESDILSILPRFIGDIEQVPPPFSAIKVGGKRAYDLARAGEEVVLKKRKVRILDLRLLSCSFAEEEGASLSVGEAEFEVRCGKGTYVRSLGRDIALALGSRGHLTMLRRLEVGGFCKKNSFSLEKLEELVHIHPPSGDIASWLVGHGVLLPPDTALDDILAVRVSKEQETRLRNGQPVPFSAVGTLKESSLEKEETGEIKVLGFGGLVALAEKRGRNLFPSRVFCCD